MHCQSIVYYGPENTWAPHIYMQTLLFMTIVYEMWNMLHTRDIAQSVARREQEAFVHLLKCCSNTSSDIIRIVTHTPHYRVTPSSMPVAVSWTMLNELTVLSTFTRSLTLFTIFWHEQSSLLFLNAQVVYKSCSCVQWSLARSIFPGKEIDGQTNSILHRAKEGAYNNAQKTCRSWFFFVVTIPTCFCPRLYRLWLHEYLWCQA